jgi:hypothetical protein
LLFWVEQMSLNYIMTSIIMTDEHIGHVVIYSC